MGFMVSVSQFHTADITPKGIVIVSKYACQLVQLPRCCASIAVQYLDLSQVLIARILITQIIFDFFLLLMLFLV